MGTNYYLRTGQTVTKTCDCGFEHEIEEVLHIGKSSCGWKFLLHIIPDRGINELTDWKPLLKAGAIEDEYGRTVSYDDMLKCILERSFPSFDRHPERGCACDPDDNLLYVLGDAIGMDGGTYTMTESEFS